MIAFNSNANDLLDWHGLFDGYVRIVALHGALGVLDTPQCASKRLFPRNSCTRAPPGTDRLLSP